MGFLTANGERLNARNQSMYVHVILTEYGARPVRKYLPEVFPV